MNPYEKCPVLESENYLLRFAEVSDAPDLLLVYSDENALPLFNSDNCIDQFHYTSLERMQQAIDFWQESYRQRHFVRWAIWDKRSRHAVGTIELFNRKADDYFTDCGLLRLDLRSDYEKRGQISELLALILLPAFDLFDCSFLATKVPPFAAERKIAVERAGFTLSKEPLIGGHDGKIYTDYYVFSN